MVKAKQLTPEQKIIGDMQRLQSSSGWKYVVNKLKEDILLIEVLLKQDAKKARTIEEIAHVNYLANKIETLEDLLIMPQRIAEEYDPIIDTNTPE